MKTNRSSISGTQKGFSLLETMIVLVLIAILASIGVPTFSRMLPDMRLRSAAQDLYGNLQTAKMEAVKSNGTSNITFYPSNGEKGTYVTANGTTVDLAVEYKNAVFYGRPDGSDVTEDFTGTPAQAIFNARGMATDFGSVYLMNTKENAFKIEILASGVMTLKKWNGSTYK